MVELIIKPKKTIGLNIKELWRFRELFGALAMRDIKVRYKQTAIGVLWAILQPFILMIVFSIFFGRVAGIQSGNVPYPIFVYSGLLFWNFFSNALTSMANSMVANQAIVQKIYFPRIIIPLSSVLVFLLDFVFATIIFVGMLIYYHISPTAIGILLVIPALLITSLAFSGMGLFFASINVKYRDIRYALPFFIQLLLFITPVIYPPSILGKFAWLWYLNPMAGVIDTMRSSLLATNPVNWQLFGVSAVVSLIFFIIGYLYFSKTEKKFADLI